MKTLHAVFVAALAASVLPTASADERASGSKPFAISFSSDIRPIAHVDFRYPSLAGSRDLSGSCNVSFAISAAGEPDAIRVKDCSSEIFRMAAKSAVKGMTFAPRATAIDNVKMDIRWTLGEAAVLRTASLD